MKDGSQEKNEDSLHTNDGKKEKMEKKHLELNRDDLTRYLNASDSRTPWTP